MAGLRYKTHESGPGRYKGINDRTSYDATPYYTGTIEVKAAKPAKPGPGGTVDVRSDGKSINKAAACEVQEAARAKEAEQGSQATKDARAARERHRDDIRNDEAMHNKPPGYRYKTIHHKHLSHACPAGPGFPGS